RAHLIPILTSLGAISTDELISLTKDPWHEVPATARSALAELAAADRLVMANVLAKVASGEADIQVLDAILALPAETLREAGDLLVDLQKSAHPDVRARAVLALSGGWTDRGRAGELARVALGDQSPTVRNSATIALRAL